MKSVLVLLVVAIACLVGAQPTLANRNAPRVTGFSFSPSTFAVAPPSAAPASQRRATTIRFKLSSRATIRIRIARKLAGTRHVTVGRLLRAKHKRGGATIAFSGRIHGRRLTPGRYVATIVAIDKRRHHSKRKTARFTVVRRGKSTPPAPTGFPGALTTGVRAGVALSPYSGSGVVRTAGTVISGKSIGCIEIAAPGVVIRDSRISCSGSAVYSGDGDYAGSGLVIEDSEIDCRGGGGTAVGEANYTLRRVNIHGCENGLDVNQNVTIEDSYIHDLYEGGDSHTDGIQLASGHFENGTLVAASRNVTIRHNTIYGVGDNGAFGTSAIISNKGGDRDILIQGNLLAGGAYTLYCEQGANGTNYRVLDNHFSTRFGPKVGAFGASTDCSDEQQSGNVIHETGQPLTLG
jgi:hypothetical protein